MATEALKFIPRRWASRGGDTESSVHTLSPYIGKLKPRIARELVERHVCQNGSVLDPFCGSGTIPFEAAHFGAVAYAFDNSPYAVLLTRAKLFAPKTRENALSRVRSTYRSSLARELPDLRGVPRWVRQFFHPQTLRQTIMLADECIERKEWFLLACLLGILHHQRPGFLSHPASHLVPYLRTKRFPRQEFPELYGPREVLPRLVAKVERTYATGDVAFRRPPKGNVRLGSVECLSFPAVDAIITSPPYMNALDYRRDNRLRLWFLDRRIQDDGPEPVDHRRRFASMMGLFLAKAARALKPGGHLVLVIGDVIRRARSIGHPSQIVLDLATAHTPELRLIEIQDDEIPDIRRSRRDCRGTKRERILVFGRA